MPRHRLLYRHATYDREAYEAKIKTLRERDKQKYKSNLMAPETLNELTYRTDCSGQRFPSYNIMDYAFSDAFHFSPQQVERMRKVVMYSPNVPGPKVKVKPQTTRTARTTKTRIAVCSEQH